MSDYLMHLWLAFTSLLPVLLGLRRPRAGRLDPGCQARGVVTMAIDWDRPDWGDHVTDSEWGSWLPEKKTGKSERR